MRSLGIIALAALIAAAAAAPAAETGKGVPADARALAGQFLVASPDMDDPNFTGTVIYMVHHAESGATGLVVNRSFGSGPLREFLKGFGIENAATEATIRLHYGGPVRRNRGFVLHTGDYQDASTIAVNERVSLSLGVDVLKAIAEGRGPRRSLFALGYAGWGPLQLEGEIARDSWVIVPADENLIFDDDLDSKWDRAMKKRGIPL